MPMGADCGRRRTSPGVLHFGSSCPARKGSPLRRGHDPPALHGRVVDAAILFLALVTWACFQLGLNLATTDFGFLIAIVLLSHFDGFVSSVSSRSLPSVASTTSSWRSPASR